jgi:hypothetical protein
MVLAILVVSVVMALLKWFFGFHFSWAALVSAVMVPVILAAVNLRGTWKRTSRNESQP